MERYFAAIRKGKISAYMELGRPWNALLPSILLVVSAIVLETQFEYTKLLLGATTLFLGYIGGATVNDIVDKVADKINMPYRPIPSGLISEQEAIAFTLVTYLISVVAALLVSFEFLIVAIIYILLGIFYSAPPLSFEKQGIFAQISLAIITGLMPALGGAVIAVGWNNIPGYWWAAFLSFSLLFAAVLVFKDFKDTRGDRVAGKTTFVIQAGEKTAYYSGLVGIAVSYPIVIYSFNGLFNSTTFLLLSGILGLTIFFIAAKVRKNPERTFAKLRISMLGVILLLILVALQIIPKSI